MCTGRTCRTSRTPRRITFTPCIIQLYSRKALRRDRHTSRRSRGVHGPRGPRTTAARRRRARAPGARAGRVPAVWQSGTSGSLPNGDEMEASYSLDTLHSCRRGSTQGRRQLHLCASWRLGRAREGGGSMPVPASSIESERRHARKPNGTTRIDARAHAPRLTPKSIFHGCTLYIISCVIWGPFDLLIHRCGMSAPGGERFWCVRASRVRRQHPAHAAGLPELRT